VSGVLFAEEEEEEEEERERDVSWSGGVY